MKKKPRNRKKRDFHRSVYVLPNFVTTLNMFCGFFAIISGIQGQFSKAAWAIVIAGVFDNLDGKIARATNTTSRFGVEYDSLADLLSFGMAPGILVYLWALQPFDRLGWLAAFLFVACGALRLARFNTQVNTVSSDRFVGLPIPAAAGMTATTILFCHRLGQEAPSFPVTAIVLVMIYILSFLMVSNISYNSFKKRSQLRHKNFNLLVAAILILIFVATAPDVALFLFGVCYVTSGPLLAIIRKIKAPAHAEAGMEDPNENII